ncbi:MAG: DEAD/DEAH box helicase [Pseudomonadota bacterium]
MESPHASTPSFASFDLPATLQQGLDDIGFDRCTEIQGLSLPHALNDKDVAGQAQTGTGKTAAFLIATYAKLLRTEPAPTRRVNQPRALILAPTRELAIQIHKDATEIGAHTGLELALAYGGVDYEKQRQRLIDGVDILIGTPGRIIDYFKQNVFDLQCLQVVVLDEADRMFDLGFIADIRYLLRRMPAPTDRLSMLFSATLSHRVLELAYEHMNEPENVKTDTDQVTADRVEQSLYHPAKEEKPALLVGLLRHMQPERSMVFVNTKVVADRLLGWLLGNGFKADVLSGDVRQTKRQRLLQDFGSGTIDILIGTDVAARGLHIPGVTHVFNYDLPQQQEDYVHRIGRTARAGAKGEAISFACEEYAFSLPDIEEYIGQPIPTAAITNDLLPELSPPKRIARRDAAPGRDGKRGAGRSSGGRRGDGRRSDSRRGDSRRSEAPRAKKREGDETQGTPTDAAPAHVEVDVGAPDAEQPKRKRRRSRRRGKPADDTGQTDGAATQATPSSDQPSDSADAAARKPRRRRGGRNRRGRKPEGQAAAQSGETRPQSGASTATPTDTTGPSPSGLLGTLRGFTRKLFGKS